MASRGMPSMVALLGLLAVAGYQNREKIADMLRGQGQAGSRPGTAGQGGGQGGILDNLGGLFGGASAGSVLSGGLGDLVDRLRQQGHGETADSWVARGPNKQLSSQQLEQALGSDVVDSLVQRTGLTREDLLSRLARTLPEAVDKYTPEGRLPSAEEADRLS
jgi:uncharacterized protein YidB (DUF937 family)